MRTGHQNSHSINLIKLYLHVPRSGIQMEQRYKVRSLLPHRRSWGSGRWRCTWTANSKQIPPMIQRYIPTNVQRNDSNSSVGWVMHVSLAWVLLPVYFRASSRRRGRRRRNYLLGEERTDGRDALAVGWPKFNGEGTRVVGMSSWGGSGQGLPFLWPLRAVTVSWPSRYLV
jgi:hypothetical protein